MRVNTDLTDEDRERVSEYAAEHGLRMSRAYAELVRADLDAEQSE